MYWRFPVAAVISQSDYAGNARKAGGSECIGAVVAMHRLGTLGTREYLLSEECNYSIYQVEKTICDHHMSAGCTNATIDEHLEK
jgi:hypothetical protein